MRVANAASPVGRQQYEAVNSLHDFYHVHHLGMLQSASTNATESSHQGCSKTEEQRAAAAAEDAQLPVCWQCAGRYRLEDKGARADDDGAWCCGACWAEWDCRANDRQKDLGSSSGDEQPPTVLVEDAAARRKSPGAYTGPRPSRRCPARQRRACRGQGQLPPKAAQPD